MKQVLIDILPFKFEKSALNESLKNGKLLVSGVIQRADSKNQNGRVYPEGVLKNSTNIYMQNFVKQRRAMGELDHPECHRASAQALTIDGWKYIEDIVVNEKIATLNTKTNSIEYQPALRVINEPYKGKMISIKGKNIDLLVTPNHRFVLNTRNGEFIEKTAQEIFEISKINKYPHLSIPTVADNWDGIKYDIFKIDAVKVEDIANNQSLDYTIKQTTSLDLNASAWFSFLGFYLAEGHCVDRNTSTGYGIFITQNKGEIADEFREILKQLSPELKWNEWDKGDGGTVFNTSDARLWTYLSKLGNKYNKHIPQEIKDASQDLLQNLYDWYLNGDGTVVGDYERSSIFSVSKELIEDLYEIILKLGMTGVIKEQVITDDYMFAGRLIEAKNKVPLYRLWIKESKAIHLDFRFIKIKEVDYDDRVYCLTVDNGVFYCRDLNKCFWSGNSSVVNLKNVSHNITDMGWDGKNLVGTIEILPTPSGNILRDLLQSGILLGISSRGQGSVTRDIREGSDVVLDDYDLIAFDFVSNPSVQGAFMYPMGKINESVDQKIVINPYSNVERIIHNILSEL
jgi:intein/homing endonuclease